MEVANLGTTQATYVTARQAAAASGKQYALDLTAAGEAQVAANKCLNVLKVLTMNGATSEADITSMAFVAYSGRPPVPPLVPPDSIDIKPGKKGSGKVTVSAHEVAGPRRTYAAQGSPNPVTPTSYYALTGGGKSRKLSGPSGTQMWVQFALVRGQEVSAWSTPVLITFP